MKVLLTNDDGYQADGIQILKEKLTENHEVFLCAPLRQMSATSHAITLFKPMELKKLNDKEYAIDGTPADCIKVALSHLYKDVAFDLVISGINNNPNMGDDVFYSGTVAGAREGSMNGLFSLAVSMDGWEISKDYSYPSQFISELLDKLKPDVTDEHIILNINFPKITSPKGVRITHLGERVYLDRVKLTESGGKNFVTVEGDDPTFRSDPGSDLNVVAEGFISITPIENEVYEKRLRKKIQYLEKTQWNTLLK